MGKKWGSNEDIHVGDIFHCYSAGIPSSGRPKYYQVVALRGKTQVVLHAIRSETFFNEGIPGTDLWEDGLNRTRSLPGQFMTEQEMWKICAFEVRGKRVRITGEEVTAWVQPERRPDGRPWLLEVGPGGWRLGYYYELERPEDWEPWTAETFKRWEEEDRARQAEQAKKAESQS